MTPETERNVHKILKAHKRIITMSEGVNAGLTRSFIKNRVRSGKWRRKYRGTYVTVTGSVEREAEFWAALRRAGKGAVLSHWSAAEVHGLLDKPFSVIHVTVPAARNPARCGRIPGLRIHRSDLVLDRKVVSNRTLPCTRVEHTVIDLINASPTFDVAYDWICRAIGRWKTTVTRLQQAMRYRRRVRYRRDIERVLEAASGAMSWLEARYILGVEIPHGLPTGTRQALVRQDTGSTYIDILYEKYLACVELDGAVAHPEDEQWDDKDRDRWNLVHKKIVTARFGVRHLRTEEDLCQAAADVAKLLNDRGPAVGHPCTRPGCVVPNYVQ